MGKISAKVGFLIPKGASTAVDECAYKIAKEQGFDALKDIAKLSFKNTDKVKALLEAK